MVDEQIAHNMGINVATLYSWKKKYNEIDNALKKGKEVVDIEVENALLKKALGYNAKVLKHYKIKEKKYDRDADAIVEEEKLIEVFDEVHIPADTTAQIFWLKNRKPQVWRDKQEVTTNVEVEDLSALADLLK